MRYAHRVAANRIRIKAMFNTPSLMLPDRNDPEGYSKSVIKHIRNMCSGR